MTRNSGYPCKIYDLVNGKFDKIIKFYDLNYTFQDYFHVSKARPGLINLNRLTHSFGSNFYEILNPASSGDESEIENNNEKILNQPTVDEVVQTMTDPFTIKIVEDISLIPKGLNTALIFELNKIYCEAFELKDFISEINDFKKNKYVPEIEEVRIIQTTENTFLGYVVPSDISDVETIFNHFNYDNRKQLKVNYGYDILDSKKSNWFGAILRNIPENLSSENIKKICEHFGINIDYALRPMIVRETPCTIIRTNNLEDAENICVKLPNNLINIKANLHPKCCKLRSNSEKSIFKHFYFKKSNNEYKKNDEMSKNSKVKLSNINDSLIEMISNNTDDFMNGFLKKKRIIKNENNFN